MSAAASCSKQIIKHRFQRALTRRQSDNSKNTSERFYIHFMVLGQFGGCHGSSLVFVASDWYGKTCQNLVWSSIMIIFECRKLC